MGVTRRGFLAGAALSSASIALRSRGEAQMQDMGHMDHGQHADHSQHSHPKPERPKVPRLPAMICRVASTVSIDAAFGMLLKGGDTLDAALHVCTTQEDDPKDHTNGLGGLPNSVGEVQLAMLLEQVLAVLVMG